jgi:4-amino-4-deoxy-L-arabinose transferase-like glycosyltransferase
VRAGLVLSALLLASTLPALGARDFAADDEPRHADALRGLLHEGHGVVLHVNGEPYPDKPPVYFWLVGGLARLLGDEGPAPFHLAAALSGVALLFATLRVARRVGGLTEPGALAAGLVVLGTPLVLLLTRTTRMDVLFAALVVLSQTSLHLGLRPGGRARDTVTGGVLAALATLVKGPYGIVLPAAGAVAELVAERRLRRLLAKDVGAAAGAALVLLGGALLAMEAVAGPGYLARLFTEQIAGRGAGAKVPHPRPWWWYAAVLPAVALPWTLALAWRPRAPGAAAGRTLLAWTAAGVLVLSVPSSKFANYLLPLLVPVAILAAQALPRVPAAAWRALGLATAALGALAPLADRLHPWPLELPGLVPLAAIVVVAGLGASLLARRGAGTALPAPLPVLVGGALAAALWASVAIAPALDGVLSPAEQARTLSHFASRGYAPMAYRVYPGIYAWHAGRRIPHTGDLEEVRRLLADPGPVVLATARKYVGRPAEREVLAGMRVVQEQWIVDQPFVVLVRDPPAVDPAGAR